MSGFDNGFSPRGGFGSRIGFGSAQDATVVQGEAAMIVFPDYVLTVEEGQQIEVVVTAVVRFLDDGAPGIEGDQAAQIRGAVDTIRAVTKMPEPSRTVIGWALNQLQSVPAGFLTGLAANYFPQLLHAMHG